MGTGDSRHRGRDRPEPLIRRAGWWAWLTVQNFFRDHGLDQSATLAYFSLLALVPLLAVVAALYRSFFSSHAEDLVGLVTAFLPFSSETITRTLNEFVRRAGTVGGIGSVVFLLVGFRLYLLIEEALNRVWSAPARRRVSVRFLAFTVVLFWGPVVIGLGSTLQIWLRHQGWGVDSPWLLALMHYLLPFVGLTMVYLLAPHTTVRPLPAIVGGATATVGLQLLKAGFVAYVKHFPQVNIIYGSLTLVILFLVSLSGFWILVLLGAEASYVAQNLEVLLRRRRDRKQGAPDPILTPLLLLLACYRFVRDQARPPTLDELSQQMGIDDRTTGRFVELLVDRGLLAGVGGEHEAYLPVVESTRITLGEVVERLWPARGITPPGADPVLARRLEDLLESARLGIREPLAGIALADLLDTPQPGGAGGGQEPRA